MARIALTRQTRTRAMAHLIRQMRAGTSRPAMLNTIIALPPHADLPCLPISMACFGVGLRSRRPRPSQAVPAPPPTTTSAKCKLPVGSRWGAELKWLTSDNARRRALLDTDDLLQEPLSAD